MGSSKHGFVYGNSTARDDCAIEILFPYISMTLPWVCPGQRCRTERTGNRSCCFSGIVHENFLLLAFTFKQAHYFPRNFKRVIFGLKTAHYSQEILTASNFRLKTTRQFSVSKNKEGHMMIYKRTKDMAQRVTITCGVGRLGASKRQKHPSYAAW